MRSETLSLDHLQRTQNRFKLGFVFFILSSVSKQREWLSTCILFAERKCAQILIEQTIQLGSSRRLPYQP